MVRPSRTSQNPAAQGASSSELRRLFVLFLCGAALTAVVMGVLGDDEGEQGTIVIPGSKVQPGEERHESDPTILPWKTHAKELNKLISETQIGRLEPDKGEAINKLAVPLSRRPHYHFKYDPEYAKVGGYERVDPKELANPDNARQYRGRPVEVVGELVGEKYVDPALYELDETVFPSTRPLVEGVIRTDEGVEVKILEPRTEGKANLVFGNQRYKAMGVFYRVVEGGEDRVKRPFVLAKKITQALPLRLRDKLESDLADRIRETEENDLRRPPQSEPEFYELLGYILKMGLAAIPEGATPIVLEGRDPQNRPDDYRLKPVRMKGILIYLKKESFEYEDMRAEDAPIRGYWHAIISDDDPDVNVPASILIPADSLPRELEEWAYAYNSDPDERRRRPQLDVTGLYYRLHSYESRGGRRRNEEVHLPVIVAVGMPLASIMHPGEPTDTKGFMLAFIGVGAGIVLVLVMMLARDRRKSRALEEHMRESRMQRRKSRGMDLNRPPEQSASDDEQSASDDDQEAS